MTCFELIQIRTLNLLKEVKEVLRDRTFLEGLLETFKRKRTQVFIYK